MTYFFEWLLDRLPLRVRVRLWDLLMFFSQDDEALVVPEPAAQSEAPLLPPGWSNVEAGKGRVSSPKQPQ